MKRYHILKDGNVEDSTATRDQAIQLIRAYQEDEKKKHQWLHANFSIIYGEEEFIPYSS